MFWFLVLLTINFQFLIAISNVLCPVEQLRIPPPNLSHTWEMWTDFCFQRRHSWLWSLMFLIRFSPPMMVVRALTHGSVSGYQVLVSEIGLNLKRLSCPCFLPVGYSLSLRLSYPHNFQLWSFCWRWAALVSEQLTSLYSNDNMWNQHIL